MSRREFPAKVKVLAFRRANGHCESCTAFLRVGKFHYDHVNPDAMTGEPTLENCRVLCLACHSAKTRGDITKISRAKRREAKHIGAKAPSRHPLPGGKRSPWKIKINGEVVART